MTDDLETRMNAVLERMGIPLAAVWLPSDNPEEHARINLEEGLAMVFDKDERQALTSLFHEVLEYRIRKVIHPYRSLVNKLIELVEAEFYAQKEKVLSEILNDFGVWKELGDLPAPTEQPRKKSVTEVE